MKTQIALLLCAFALCAAFLSPPIPQNKSGPKHQHELVAKFTSVTAVAVVNHVVTDFTVQKNVPCEAAIAEKVIAFERSCTPSVAILARPENDRSIVHPTLKVAHAPPLI